MSVTARQEVPGRWPPFNAAIIVTIVWIDNHAHYRERWRERRGGRGRKLEALRATRLRPRFVSDGRGGGEGTRSSGGMCCRLGCMGKACLLAEFAFDLGFSE